MDVPVIETARLVLRGWQVTDFERFAGIWADPQVTRLVGVPARDRAESWRALLKIAGGWALLGHGQWAVVEREGGRILGQCGFFDVQRGYGPAFDSFPEAGWVLAPEAQGRGIGREAVSAAHEWFDAHVGGPCVAQISPANAASRALAARMGYEVFEDRDDVLLLRRG